MALVLTLFLLYNHDLLFATSNPSHYFTIQVTTSVTDCHTATHCLSNKKDDNPFAVLINDEALNSRDSFRLVIDISNDLMCHNHLVDLTVSAGKALGMMFKACNYFA